MSQRRDELEGLTTEARNPRTKELDTVSTLEMVRMINDENRVLAQAVDGESEAIARAVDLTADRLKKGGRLIYIGAGTSGRLGVLDASECPPTFSMDPGQVVGIIAGGDRALRLPSENAEDKPETARADLAAVGVCAKDVVCGSAASGRPPYAAAGLQYAREKGAATLCITNNKNSLLGRYSDVAMEVDVGPEALTGSTRMKSGTAQKLVLNLLSTGVAVRLGKVYSNLMVDVKASNVKLNIRCLNILGEIFPDKTEEEFSAALAEAGGSVKLAAVILGRGLDAAGARQLLDRCGGDLRKALEEEV